MALDQLLIVPNRGDMLHIWRLAWPLIISNLSVPLLGLADTAIMGHLSHAQYLGAVSIGATIITFVYWSFGFLRMGTVGLTAQAFGAGDKPTLWQMLYLPSILALGIGTLILVSSPLYLELIIGLMQAGDDIAPLTLEYLSIRVFSAPAVLCTYVAMGWLLGQQDSRGPLAILVVTNISNIVFNLILVWGFDFKSDGVAWGSLAADYVGFGVALWLVWRTVKQLDTNLIMDFGNSRIIIAKIFSLNIFLFVRTILLLFAFAFITAQSANMSTQILAANTLLLQFITLLAYFLDGFAHAAEASCGAAIGRKHQEKFYQTVNAVSLFCFILATMGSLGFFFFHTSYFAMLTNIPTVLRIASDYANWVVWVPLISVWSYVMDGVFVGATKTKAMLHTVWSSVAAMLVMWYLLEPNNDNLWLVFLVFCAVRACVAIGYYVHIHQQRAWW